MSLGSLALSEVAYIVLHDKPDIKKDASFSLFNSTVLLSIHTTSKLQRLDMAQPASAESNLSFILVVLSEVQEWKIDWKRVQVKTGLSRADVG